MTDNIRANFNIRTMNFMQNDKLSISKLEELLKKEGRFSLDDAGNVIVINPPRKRDGFFVSFFKSHILGTQQDRERYKTFSRQLDNMDKLSKNASFLSKLKESFVNLHFKNNNIIKGKLGGVHALDEVVRKTMLENIGQLTTGMLKGLVNNDKSLAYKAIDDAIGNLSFDTIFDKSAIEVGGKRVGLLSFINEHGTGGQKNIDMKVFTQKIIGRCLAFPQVFSQLGKEQDATLIKNLMSKVPFTEADADKLSQTLTGLMHSIKASLGNFAQKAVYEGKSLDAIADKLSEHLDLLGKKVAYWNSNEKNVMDIFSNAKQTTLIDRLPQRQGELAHIDDPDINAVKAIHGVDTDENAALIVSYLRENNIALEDFRKFSTLCKEYDFNMGLTFNNLLKKPNGYVLHDVLSTMVKIQEKSGLDYEIFCKLMAVNVLFIDKNDDFLGKITAFHKTVHDFTETFNQRQNINTDRKAMMSINVFNMQMTTLEGVLKESKDLSLRLTDNCPLPNTLKEGVAEGLFDKALKVNDVKSSAIENHIELILGKLPKEFRNSRNFVRKYLVRQCMIKVGADGGSIADMKGYIDKIFDSLVNKKNFLAFVSDKKSSQKFNDAMVNNFLDKNEETRLVNTYLKQKGHMFKTSKYHDTFNRDIIGRLTTKINGVDLDAIENTEEKVAKAHELIDEIVPDEFKPFVTTALMQGGISSFYTYLTLSNQPISIREGETIENPLGMLEENINVINVANHSVEKKDGKLYITTKFNVGLGPTDNAGGVPNDENIKQIFLRQIEIRTEIDFTKGVDENGIPKAIEYHYVGESTDAPSGPSGLYQFSVDL